MDYVIKIENIQPTSDNIIKYDNLPFIYKISKI